MKTEILKITITASNFGTREDFYTQFAKGNREVLLEDIEFEGNSIDHVDPQHNTGVLIDTIILRNNELLTDKVREYINENNFYSECFSVRKLNDDEVILTEEDL